MAKCSRLLNCEHICPHALLELLDENTYSVYQSSGAVFVNEEAIDKLASYFGSSAVPTTNGLLGGGWLWLKFPD